MHISNYFTDILDESEIYLDTFNLAKDIIQYRTSVIGGDNNEHYETARKSSRLANIFVIKAWNRRAETNKAAFLMNEASVELYAVIASIYFLAEQNAIDEEIYKKLRTKADYIIDSINAILGDEEIGKVIRLKFRKIER